MFIAALFTIARSWKQHKCPSTDEWIKKMWYVYAMEYYSAIKGSEIGSGVETWMDLETFIQSEVSQKEKNLQARLLYTARISFRFSREIKSFSDKQKLREFRTTKPALQQMLKKIL